MVHRDALGQRSIASTQAECGRNHILLCVTQDESHVVERGKVSLHYVLFMMILRLTLVKKIRDKLFRLTGFAPKASKSSVDGLVNFH